MINTQQFVPSQSAQSTSQEPPPPVTPIQTQKTKKPLGGVLLGMLFLCMGGIGGYYVSTHSLPFLTTKACTMEAKLCPDGSSVGRTGLNCEFALCPTAVPDPTAYWKTYVYGKYGYSFKYPSEYAVEERAPGFVVIVAPEEHVAQSGISIESRLLGHYADYADTKNIITSTNAISETKTLGDWEIFQGTGKDGMLRGVEFRFGIAPYKTGAIEVETLATTPYVKVFDQILSTFIFTDTTTTPTPSITSALAPKILPYSIPSGWQPISDASKLFEVSYNPTTHTVAVAAPSRISLSSKAVGANIDITLLPYTGGSPRIFITQNTGAKILPTTKEVDYRVNGKSGLVQYDVDLSGDTTVGMIVADSSHAWLITSSTRDVDFIESVISTLKLL